ncbi:MAG: MoxR family ATPase [Planctomycetes bacterium]|jgi:MoxR-like ATPase|nr:MoxR family ATPase [Planctomycetota bacterium]
MATTATEPVSTRVTELRERLGRVVAIDDATLDAVLVALFAGGHVLIEGVPGIGKTLLARTLARCVDCEFRRIQFTNDLMPTDVVGAQVWRSGSETFEFVPGPLFANIVLADEINRTSPRTLSCLLEAMENGKVTVEGRPHELADPFLVLATRNPIEFHGTFPVPEAALDRFLVRVELGYPSAERELALYRGESPEALLAALHPVLDRATLRRAIERTRRVAIAEPVARYALRVVDATRHDDALMLGASPRAAIAWLAAGRARAFLMGRDFVLPDDLKQLAVAVLAHRLIRKDGGPSAEVVEQTLARIRVEL